MSALLVSCICPTTERRREWLPRAIASFQAQRYPNTEMVIVSEDDSLRDLIPADDLRVKFCRGPRHITLGEKRNLCAGISRGDLICHSDDDDWSAPGRINDQVQQLLATGAQVTGYNSLLVRETRDVRVVENGRARRTSGWWRQRNADPTYAWGATFCYRRSWWESHPFPKLQLAEDDQFWVEAMRAGASLAVDGHDFMYVTNHRDNVSQRAVCGAEWVELPGCPYD